MAKAPINKTPLRIGSIDLTPTWRGLLPALVEPAARGNQQCLDELYRIADYADLMPKKINVLIEDLIKIGNSVGHDAPVHRAISEAMARFAIPQTLEQFLQKHQRSAPIGPDEPAKIYATLAELAPQIQFKAKGVYSPGYKWDGDGPDPVTQGFHPFDVSVTASTVVAGCEIQGEEMLSGHYIETDKDVANTEKLGDIGGYLPQLLQEALEKLTSECRERQASDGQLLTPELQRQASAADKYLEGVLKARWQLQNPAEMTQETFEAILAEFTSLTAETMRGGEPFDSNAIARLDRLSTAMGAAPWLNDPQQGLIAKPADKAAGKGRSR